MPVWGRGRREGGREGGRGVRGVMRTCISILWASVKARWAGTSVRRGRPIGKKEGGREGGRDREEEWE
jgi:hypothetical protein